jgi:hypothetical protein
MKNRIMVILLCVFFVVSVSGQVLGEERKTELPELTVERKLNRAAQEPQPYCKVESAIIKYEYYGLDEGTVTLFIKDNGKYVRRDDKRIKTSDEGEKTLRFFYLLTPKDFYQADLHQGNMAVRMDRPADMASMILIHEILYGESADSLDTDKRYKKEADEEVAGQMCKVYYDEISAEKYWVWNDIILKTESLDWETKEPSGKRALTVELDPEFKKGTFEIPEGLEVIGM